MEEERNKYASEVLEDVVKNGNSDNITFMELKESLHERGFGLLMLIFSLPLVVVPPGLTTLFTMPVALISGQMIIGFNTPWFPQWLGNKSIKRKSLAYVIEKLTPILYKVERLLQPRLYFASSKKGERIIGIFAFIFSISIAVPLPFTNLVPAIAIAAISLGMLSRDGLFIIIGMILGTLGCLVTLTVLLLGSKAITALVEQISSLFGV